MGVPPGPEHGSHFDVLVVGPFALYRDGTPIDAAGWQRKVRSLFRILVTSPERRRSRDELVDMLWPEAGPDAGSRNLRVVLHMLRRGLGAADPPAILSEWGWISLNPAHEWDIDLERFVELAERDDIADLEEAAGYYRGEPLAEDRYEDWALAVRGRVQRLWQELCLRLARLHQERGAAAVAIVWLDRVLESDPLNEEALGRLLVNLGQMGRRTEALRRFHHFAAQLREALDVPPGRELLAVVAELRSQSDDAPARPQPAAPPGRPIPVIPRYTLAASGRLVGRERELGRILWTLPPMHEVAPRLVTLAAEAGMGKTRLLAEVAARARTAGILTLAGGCYRYEGAIAYGPIRDALADYVEAQPESVLRDQLHGLDPILRRIVPELSFRFTDAGTAHHSADDERLLLFLAVTRALERIAQGTPLVFLLDDLQWADEGTLRMLHFIVRQSTQNQTLIVGAYSVADGESEPPVARMVADMEQAGWATRVVLPPLTQHDLGYLIEERVRGCCADGLIATLHGQSGGNPLVALGLLRDWQQEGRVHQSRGHWQFIAPALVDPLARPGDALA